MVPDYQSLMRPLLEVSAEGETHIGDAIDRLAEKLNLTEEDISELLPSRKQSRFDNRVRWAKTYLKQAGLIEYTKRGHFKITQRGVEALQSAEKIDNNYLKKFDDFLEFKERSNTDPESSMGTAAAYSDQDDKNTPTETIRASHDEINRTLAAELLDRVRTSPPSFFESLIIELLLAMGYGGATEDAGQTLGRSGDGGLDGVINQDPLGVDQIYVQAKRNSEGNNVGPSAIRDFAGALNIARANKGIFFTTAKFTPDAKQSAASLGSKIVLIDGGTLSRLMIRYSIGCQEDESFVVKKIDDDFFDQV